MRGVGWLDDPDVLLAVMLLQLLVVLIELSELIRQDVCIRRKVVMLFAILLLHPHYVEAKPVLPGDLMTLREMVDLLIFIQALVQIALTAAGGPQDVPLMALSWGKVGKLKH